MLFMACNTDPRGQHLKTPKDDPTFNRKRVFNNLAFPVVCTKSSVTHTFRVSWDGHKGVTDSQDSRYHPEWPNMSDEIGFPSMASLVVAANAYVHSDKARSLGELYIQQYRSIDTRYPYKEHGAKKQMKVPHYQQLEALQNLISGAANLNANAFNCVLLSRKDEWFLTTELVTSS